MRAVEWNKKEELVADQALRHLKVSTLWLVQKLKKPFAVLVAKQYHEQNFNK